MVGLMVVAATVIKVVGASYATDIVIVSSVIPKERRAIVTSANAPWIIDIGGVAAVVVAASTAVIAVVIDGIVVVIVAIVIATSEAAEQKDTGSQRGKEACLVHKLRG